MMKTELAELNLVYEEKKKISRIYINIEKRYENIIFLEVETQKFHIFRTKECLKFGYLPKK